MWTGPPVGIVRVERQLARWARRHRPDIRLAFFDPADGRFRPVKEAWLDPLLAGDQLSVWNAPHLGTSQRRLPRRLLQGLKLRRNLMLVLDRLRRAAPGAVSSSASWLQSAVASSRHRERMFDRSGQRRALVSYRSLLGPPIIFERDDTLVLAGSGWANVDIRAVAKDKARRGLKLVVMCHDLIPAMFPHFYPPGDGQQVGAYFDTALRISDGVIVTAETVAADVAAFAQRHGFAPPHATCIPLGADFIARGGDTVPLPEGLRPGRFALFVSTVEPRKGHDLLWRVWLRLLAEGVPQRTAFRLVFVGRAGWMRDELTAALRAAASAEHHFLWLEKAEDELLHALYDKAAFCLYPSLYEGYGLPIVEAFAHGKAVLASTGGSVPEVVAGLSPCIEAGNEEAWAEALRSWMLDPGLRQPFEGLIRTGFKHRSWDDFAAEFFGATSQAASR